MDPKTATPAPAAPSNLDPKLKEMYDRIMAIDVKPNTAAPQTQNVTPQPSMPAQPSMPQAAPGQAATAPVPSSVSPSQGGQPANTGIPTTPFMPPGNNMPITQAAAQPPVRVVQTQTIPTVTQAASQKTPTSFVAQTKKKSSLPMTILLILGGIIFLGVYTVFWIKFFDLPVPFLPF